MATIIEASLPVEEFALAATLHRCAAATIECEQIVEAPEETVMPLVWVRNTDPETFAAALDQDPTVATYTRRAATDTECLYEMDWHANIQLVLRILTTEGAVILDTTGSAAGWHLRVLFPDRDDVRMTTDFCETHNLTLNIHSFRHLDNEASPQGAVRAGLTTAQHEALTTAYEQGYFGVPRTIDLDAVADDLGISRQALSERLRRGHETLIGNIVGIEAEPAPAAHPPAASTASPDDGDTSPVDD